MKRHSETAEIPHCIHAHRFFLKWIATLPIGLVESGRMRITQVAVVLFVFFVATQAHGYKIKEASSGEPLRWGDATVKVTVATDGDRPKEIGRSAAREAVHAAFRAWESRLPSSMRLVVEDFPSSGSDGDDGDDAEGDEDDGSDGGDQKADTPKPSTRDRKNIVRWVRGDWDDDYDPDALAVTLTTYEPSSGRISDSDILINAQKYEWVVGADAFERCTGQYDLQNVVTHEVGHFLGLGHETQQVEATMYPTSGACETKKRDLDDDDVAGIAFLYEEIGPILDEEPAFGCSVSVARSEHGTAPVVALVLGLLALVARRARRLLVATLIVILGAEPTASATTTRRLELGRMASSSASVLQGTVVEIRVVEKGDRIYTDYVIVVAECWKGFCPRTVTVRQLGGEVPGKGMTVEGNACVSKGHEVVMFLRARKDGAFSPVGMAQGAFLVERGKDGRVLKLLRDLRGLVLSTPDGSASPGLLERVPIELVREAARQAR
ncbi:MAG: matrixin family metalloprotease [Deltaproteobacteria bacterium]|nr:matrixin family metalloprotease [Deltaproteobacteria bacterium]